MQCSHQTKIYVLILGIVKPILYQYIAKRKKVSELISYMQIGKEVTKLGSQELTNIFFNFYFLN